MKFFAISFSILLSTITFAEASELCPNSTIRELMGNQVRDKIYHVLMDFNVAKASATLNLDELEAKGDELNLSPKSVILKEDIKGYCQTIQGSYLNNKIRLDLASGFIDQFEKNIATSKNLNKECYEVHYPQDTWMTLKEKKIPQNHHIIFGHLNFMSTRATNDLKSSRKHLRAGRGFLDRMQALYLQFCF